MPEVVEKTSPAKRTPPNCARCKNHGVRNSLTGHKRYCLYFDCKCSKCMTTIQKRRNMAENTAYRRAVKQREIKLKEWQRKVEIAQKTGLPIPPKPAELLSPILPQKVATLSDCSSSERNLSPKSNYSAVSSDVLINDSVSSVNSRDKDEASTSDRVDLRSSLRSLQELLLQENFPLEISTLLYLILKDTPEPKKAYNRIVEAQTELNSGYTRDEIPSFYIPYFGSSRFFPPSILSSHAALSLSPSYYHQQYKQYSLANASLPLPPSCPYPPYFSAAIQTLRSPAATDFLSCAAPLPFAEDKKHRLSFDAIQLTKDTRPSNLCIRETSSSFSPLENKFSVSEAK